MTVAAWLAVLSLPGTGCRRPSAPPAGASGAPAAPVTVATATEADVPVEIRAVGRVETYNTVTIRPRVSGQIEAVHFADGQYVSTGTLLYTIDQRPFQAAVDVAKANLARDKAQAAEAAKKAQQFEEAYRRKAAAEVDRDTAVANAEAAAATVQADEATLENAQLQLGWCTIRSPIDGKAGDRLADIGNIVTENVTPLVIINQIKPIYVTFAVPERYLAEIHARMASGALEVRATTPGQAGEGKTGKLTFVDNQVNPATGAITLKGTFANDDHALWPGQFVNVALLLGVQQEVLVPTAAIQTSQEGDYVYLLMPDDTVERRTVVPGRTVGTQSVITEGLKAGDIVVTEGQLRLRPGAKVAVQQTAASQPTRP
jgi:multidrug efflux system membrane fusion protein